MRLKVVDTQLKMQTVSSLMLFYCENGRHKWLFLKKAYLRMGTNYVRSFTFLHQLAISFSD